MADLSMHKKQHQSSKEESNIKADITLHKEREDTSSGESHSERSKYADHLDHRRVGKRSLEEVLHDPKEKLVTEHENVRGLETLVFENTKTGEKQTFANVRPERLDENK